MKKGIYVGRFQPPHKAHVDSLLLALEKLYFVTIAIGSTNLASSIKNPWSFEERREMWQIILDKRNLSNRVGFLNVPDFFNDKLWSEFLKNNFDGQYIIGYEKDSSSDYLKWFPDWRRINIPVLHQGISATDIRNNYFLDKSIDEFLVPEIVEYLQKYKQTKDFEILKNQFNIKPPEIEYLYFILQNQQIIFKKRKNLLGFDLFSLPELEDLKVLGIDKELVETMNEQCFKSEFFKKTALVREIELNNEDFVRANNLYLLSRDFIMNNLRVFYADHAFIVLQILKKY